ncbi:sigma-54-dependent Fis family transcriptional regulator [Schinkia sp. CFF1]
MKSPYISIFSTDNLIAKTKELEAFWEKFVSKVKEDIQHYQLRKDILNSWKRRQESGVNPGQMQTEAALTEDQMRQITEQSELYQIAKPIIDDLFYKMRGTGYLVTLADQKGRIIYIKGDVFILHEAEKMNFAQGFDWSEKAAGTNAIGTSMITKSPLQIFSAEHFCKGCHPWTCSSAPITHPFTKEIIGAIDFTGPWNNAQPHTLAIAVSVARVIEQQLEQVYQNVNNHLMETYFNAINKWKANPVIVVNNALVVVKASEHFNRDFNLPQLTNLKMIPEFQDLIAELEMLGNMPNYHFSAAQLTVLEFPVLEVKRILFAGFTAGFVIVLKDNQPSYSSAKILQEGPWKEVVGKSESFQSVLHKCYKAAPANVPILLLGESGTGKEKIAQTIHKASQRANQPFLAINCGAIQKELIGSELFGYESGTFTGAAKEGKKGKFEEANGGTLFLDEIGEMPLDLQVHLLRVLQEKEVTRLGGSKPIPINVRIIAATHKDLYNQCKKGHFREDLFFRLNVVSVNIPPLRERNEDFTMLTEYFLKQFASKYEKNILSLSNETMNYFLEYTWPGNIRELQNALEHAVIFTNSAVIHLTDLPDYLLDNKLSNVEAGKKHAHFTMIENEERKILLQLLESYSWNLSAVAKNMNIARSTLYRKLKKYKLTSKENDLK